MLRNHWLCTNILSWKFCFRISPFILFQKKVTESVIPCTSTLYLVLFLLILMISALYIAIVCELHTVCQGACVRFLYLGAARFARASQAIALYLQITSADVFRVPLSCDELCLTLIFVFQMQHFRNVSFSVPLITMHYLIKSVCDIYFHKHSIL